jgi:EmrB/QacA subfamily drug resistance transporter
VHPDHALDPRRWRALGVTLAAGFLVLLDVSVINVALPSIQRGLTASPAEVQWVVSGYALTLGLSLVAGGRLGDLLGRRRMFLISLTAFVLTSVAAGLAPTVEILIAARLLQGLAGGLLTPQNSGLVLDLFTGAERARAFGLLGAVIGVSTAVGPVAGGTILTLFGDPDGWRFSLLLNVPIGAVALVLAARLLPRRRRDGDRAGLLTQLDLPGAILLGLAVLFLLLPMVPAEGGGPLRLWWLFGVAIAFALLFAGWERHTVRRGRPPLLDVRLLAATPGYASGAAIGLAYFTSFTGVSLVFAMFLQTGLGRSPLESGLAITPFAIGSAVASAVAGRLVSKWGRWVTVTGLVLSAAGFAAVGGLALVVSTEDLVLAVAAPLLVAGLGCGAVISPNTTMTLAEVPTAVAGVAAGAMQTGQRVGTAVGLTLLAAVFHAVTARWDYPAGLAAAMGVATIIVGLTLYLAINELRSSRENFRPKSGLSA